MSKRKRSDKQNATTDLLPKRTRLAEGSVTETLSHVNDASTESKLCSNSKSHITQPDAIMNEPTGHSSTRRPSRQEKSKRVPHDSDAVPSRPVVDTKDTSISPDDQTQLTRIVPKGQKKKKNSVINVPTTADELDAFDHSHRSWTFSDACGGQMLDIDPIISSDDQYFLVAYTRKIIVYATETSLPLRALVPSGDSSISSMSLSVTSPELIYLATSGSFVECWNWSTGRKLKSIATKGNLTHMAVVSSGEGNSSDLIHVVEEEIAQGLVNWHVRRYFSDTRDGCDNLYTHNTAITSISVHDAGSLIILTAGKQLVIGQQSLRQEETATKGVWRIVTCQDHISCINVRRERQVGKKKTKTGPDSINIALGGLRGKIYVYDDILSKMKHSNDSPSQEQFSNLVSKNLLWHRSTVTALKWSVDGNYIISGGRETVLVMWQLDSGRKDHLPHLGSPIKSIVVSPNGGFYGVRLADNSAMMLSAAELKATVSIAGIQLNCSQPATRDLPPVLTTELAESLAFNNENTPHPRNPPVCLSSTTANGLLIAAPSRTSGLAGNLHVPNAPFLQTVDIMSGQQVARQALARTKITSLEMGPNAVSIEDPNVIYLAISHDGKWLASVDEWVPPLNDLNPLTHPAALCDEQASRRETYLKFWSWNEKTAHWELVARIDHPHVADEGKKSAHVTGLIADSNGPGFLTAGLDGRLKAWEPVNRRRNGVDVKAKDGKVLQNWHLRYQVSLFSNIGDDSTSDGMNNSGRAWMAVAPDSSIIAYAEQHISATPIHLIDNVTGQPHSSKMGLYQGPLLGLGIMGKYLITLSNDLTVWDLVSDRLAYGIDLGLPISNDLNLLSNACHLGLQPTGSYFIIAVPQHSADSFKSNKKSVASKKSKKGKPGLRIGPSWISNMAIFSPSSPSPLCTTSLPTTIVAALPSLINSSTFHILDSEAEIHTLTQSFASSTLLQGSRETSPVDSIDQTESASLLKLSSDTTDEPVSDQIVLNPEPMSKRINPDRMETLFDDMTNAGPIGSLGTESNLTILLEQIAGMLVGRDD